MTNEANRWIKQAFHDLKASFPYRCRCRFCKNAPIGKLEFSHERATALSHGAKRGRKEKYYDIKNHPKSYRLRTRRCHLLRKAAQHKRFIREAQQR